MKLTEEQAAGRHWQFMLHDKQLWKARGALPVGARGWGDGPETAKCAVIFDEKSFGACVVRQF